VWRIGGMTLMGKLIYSEINLSHCHFVHHKSRRDRASCSGAHITAQKAIILINTATRTSNCKQYGGNSEGLKRKGNKVMFAR
jgi:hypothetical protein